MVVGLTGVVQQSIIKNYITKTNICKGIALLVYLNYFSE